MRDTLCSVVQEDRVRGVPIYLAFNAPMTPDVAVEAWRYGREVLTKLGSDWQGFEAPRSWSDQEYRRRQGLAL